MCDGLIVTSCVVRLTKFGHWCVPLYAVGLGVIVSDPFSIVILEPVTRIHPGSVTGCCQPVR